MEQNSNYIHIITPFFLTCLVSAAITTTDQSALLSLKSKITSDPYDSIMQNWTVASPVCNWTGVTCGKRHQRVTYLNISHMSLTGQIPPELGNLSFLISLDMAGNDFYGLIPNDLSRLRRLRYIRISANSFSGEVPSCFVFLPRLEFLYLNNNSFTSMDSFLISFSNESKLAGLDMSFNTLQGKVPESIGNLRGIKNLGMVGCKLSGSLPSSLANLTSLVVLNMAQNYIQGSLPEWIGNLRNLSILDLEINLLTGFIPYSLYNISTLRILALTQNSLSDTLPDDMCLRLPLLAGLFLSENELYGEIPSNISLCSQLQALSLSFNNFTGIIPLTLTGERPHALGELQNLEILDLSDNDLSGPLAVGIYNMTSLTIVVLEGNRLSGNLPSNPGYFLPNLQVLELGGNDFDSLFPNSILNCSELTILDISYNKLTGPIPSSIGDLRLLQILNLGANGFSSESATTELSFINSLTECRYLKYLVISGNPLNGVFPTYIGNLSSSLIEIQALGCGIGGNIPNDIGNLTGLITLDLSINNLIGEIPATFDSLVNLQRISLDDNQIGGLIPNKLCGLTNLGTVDLGTNKLRGPIPECLGNISSLRGVYLNNNNLTSGIPSNIWDLKDLIDLDVSSNSFTGSLSPRIGNLMVVTSIDLSMNQFSGDIPSTLGGLTKLVNLSLADNNFEDSIPESLGSMLSIVSLDLSHNRLNGTIPQSLEALKYLEYFNVSYNELSGEIPVNGPFQNFTSRSFMFNSALCGPSRFNVSSCPESQHRSKKKKKILRTLLILIIGIGGLIFIISSAYAMIRYRRKMAPNVVSDMPTLGQLTRFPYYELLQATENYSENNLLGKGSFGSVYKGVLRDGTILAVKVFHVQLERSLRSFEVECEVLRNLRHRNLVKVLGSCTNQDFKAIVLQYMQNGSLEEYLHYEKQSLDIMQRLDIMIDVASALEYLHHDNSTSLVHCDLKPGNILLDENMVAHVSDFGITKYLNQGESITHTRTLATLGYMAPEYGSEGIVSTRCDVYSYGIMLLETFTRKRPSDDMFSGGITLREWVKGSMPDAVVKVIDANLISPQEINNFSHKLRCIFSVLDLGVKCSANSPDERESMNDVSAEIKKIKIQLVTSYRETSRTVTRYN